MCILHASVAHCSNRTHSTLDLNLTAAASAILLANGICFTCPCTACRQRRATCSSPTRLNHSRYNLPPAVSSNLASNQTCSSAIPELPSPYALHTYWRRLRRLLPADEIHKLSPRSSPKMLAVSMQICLIYAQTSLADQQLPWVCQ